MHPQKQLTLGTFRLRQVANESNVRAQPMRRVELVAADGEALTSLDALPEGVVAAPVAAGVHALVNREAAAFFDLDDEYDVILKKRE